MATLLGVGTLLCVIAFALTWAVCIRVRNYSFLDAAFSYGVAVLAPLYAWYGPAPAHRKTAFVALGGAWSLRLGTYLLLRILRHHPKEDARYGALRDKWQGPWMFLLFFEMQALLVVLFSLPFLVAAFNPSPEFHPLECAGLGIAALALLGEAVADWQMQLFKKNPGNQNGVCQIGLWNYSRHPNYFFEALLWCGFAMAALPSPWGWVCLLCPVLMLYFLLRVTGIPLTEEYAVKSKGDAYREYQRTTSALVPWFKKTAHSMPPPGSPSLPS
jgi:steroid 5-alpha reductase family enzyme